MSLDDRFNPNDGSLIDRVDGALLKVHKKLGEVWQNKTYKGKDELERGLHGLSSGAYLISAASGFYAAVPLALMEGGRCLFGSYKHRTGLEQEISDEVMGLPKKFGKYTDVLLYGSGALVTFVGTYYLGSGIFTGGSEEFATGKNLLGPGLGLTFLKTADYIEKTDLGEPPKKPRKKPFLERIKEKGKEFFPSPVPQPISTESYLG